MIFARRTIHLGQKAINGVPGSINENMPAAPSYGEESKASAKGHAKSAAWHWDTDSALPEKATLNMHCQQNACPASELKEPEPIIRLASLLRQWPTQAYSAALGARQLNSTAALVLTIEIHCFAFWEKHLFFEAACKEMVFSEWLLLKMLAVNVQSYPCLTLSIKELKSLPGQVSCTLSSSLPILMPISPAQHSIH